MEEEVLAAQEVGGIIGETENVYDDALFDDSTSATILIKKQTGRGLPSFDAIINFGGERVRLGDGGGGIVMDLVGE
jgi:hypothetical protein